MTGLLRSVGLGCALMYAFDPELGEQRRAKLKQKAHDWLKRVDDAASQVTDEVGERARSLFAESQAVLQPRNTSDAVIAARVRMRVGRIVSHPSAVRVEVAAGRVILSGPILKDELDSLIDDIRSMRGVADVENRLVIHDNPADVAAWEPRLARGESVETLTGSQRLAVGASGGLLLYVLVHRIGLFGLLSGLFGAALIARSFRNAGVSAVVEEPAPSPEAPSM